jgi:hypothetical protein
LSRALVPGLVCSLLFAYWVLRRRWAQVAGLAAALVLLAQVATLNEEAGRVPMSHYRHAWPVFLFLGLLVTPLVGLFGYKKSRGQQVLFLALIVLLILGTAGLLVEGEMSKAPEDRYSWAGWSWLVPFVLARAGRFTVEGVFMWVFAGLLTVGMARHFGRGKTA